MAKLFLSSFKHSCVRLLSCYVVSDSVTLWTVAHQTPPSMGFSRQEYWSGLSFPSPGDLPDPGIKPRSPILQQILYHLNYREVSKLDWEMANDIE